MEQYNILQYSRRSGAPWTVLWQWVGEWTRWQTHKRCLFHVNVNQFWSELVLILIGIEKDTFSRSVATYFVPEVRLICYNYATTPGTAGAIRATWLSLWWYIVIRQDAFGFFRAQTGELNRDVIGAVIPVSFGSLRVAPISTMPPESYCFWDPGWVASAWPFPSRWLLLHRSRTQCEVAPSANFVNSSGTLGNQGNDHWVDLWTQWTYCKPDLDQDFVYYLGLISPTLTGIPGWYVQSLSINWFWCWV